MNLLKSLNPLMTSQRKSFITVKSIFANDIFGNNVVPVTPSLALLPITFSNDTVSPKLNLYTLDMNRRQIFLRFSESFSFLSLKLSEISVQSTFTLSFGVEVNLFDSTVLAGIGTNSTDIFICIYIYIYVYICVYMYI
jgi:hypothetical protein